MSRVANYKESKKNDRIAFLITVLVSLIAVWMFILNLNNKTYLNVWVSIAYLTTISSIYGFYIKNRNFSRWANWLLIISGITLIYLFYQGGTRGAGVLWAILFPYVSYQFKGTKIGTIYNLVLFACIFFIFILALFGLAPMHHSIPFFVVYFTIFIAATGFLYVNNKRSELSEKIIVESKDKYEALLNDLSIGVVMISPELKVLEVNRKIKQWFPDITISDNPYCFEALNDTGTFNGPCSNCQILRVFEEGKSFVCTQNRITASGERCFKITSNPMKDHPGKVYAVTETLEDITESRRMQQLLEESEKRFRTLFEHIPQVAVQGYDRELKVIFWNKASETLYGIPAADALGKKLDDLILPEELREKMARVINKWFETDQVNPSSELLLKRADGTYVHVYTSSILISNLTGEKELYSLEIDLTERKKTEISLKLSEERYRGLFEGSKDAMLVLDAENFTFTSVNRAALEIFRCSSEKELVGTHPGKISPEFQPDGRQSMEKSNELLNQAVKSGSQYFEWMHRRFDGELFYSIVLLNVIQAGGKKIIQSTVRDITEQKKAEEALRMSEARLRAIFDSVNMAISITDTTGKYVMFNRWWTEYLGYSPEEFRSMTNVDITHPDDIEKSQKCFRSAVAGETDKYRIEKRYIRKNKSVVWSDLSVSVIKDENGNVTHLAAIIVDITERKMSQQQIMIQNSFQRLIANISTGFINTSPENIDHIITQMLTKCGKFLRIDRTYIFRFSDDTRYISTSHEWCATSIEPIKGYVQNFPGKTLPWFYNETRNCRKIYIPDTSSASGEITADLSALARHQVKSILLLPMVKNKTLMGYMGYESIREKRTIDEKGIELLQVISNIVTDALEKNKMELLTQNTNEKLKELNSTKDKLFSIISHDLRSPFNALISLTEVMTDKEMDFTLEEMTEMAAGLHQSAKTTFKLVENLLQWSRLQRGLIKPEPRIVNINRLTEQIIENHADAIQQKNQTVETEINEKIMAMVDEKMIEAVIRNLLSNAIKFTPKHGKITVKASKDSLWSIYICIADNGIGIPEDIKPLLFTVDEKKGRKGTEGETSSGLGLILCKEFIELNQGSIWVESEEGKGSAFYIRIPAYQM
ncbi:MAG: PAS domain S-box protein [Sphingobacteriia bacterium]|nr:PAS domain S-box protein [Sphingobacteriia bacterium]